MRSRARLQHAHLPHPSRLCSQGGGASSPAGSPEVVIHQRGALADSEALLKLSTLQAAHEQLISENKQLQEALKRTLETSLKQQQEILKAGPKAGSKDAPATGGAVSTAMAAALPTCKVEPTTLQIDLVKLLGPEQFVTGISYDPYVCYPGLAVRRQWGRVRRLGSEGSLVLISLWSELLPAPTPPLHSLPPT
jgi:hypothetical protein